MRRGPPWEGGPRNGGVVPKKDFRGPVFLGLRRTRTKKGCLETTVSETTTDGCNMTTVIKTTPRKTKSKADAPRKRPP